MSSLLTGGHRYSWRLSEEQTKRLQIRNQAEMPRIRVAPSQNSEFAFWLMVSAILILAIVLISGAAAGQERQSRRAALEEMKRGYDAQVSGLRDQVKELQNKIQIQQKTHLDLLNILVKTNLLVEKLSKKWELVGLEGKIKRFEDRLAYLEEHQQEKEAIEKELMKYKQYEVLRKPPIQ